MTNKRIEEAVFVTNKKWTPNNDVHPLHEGPELSFDRERTSNIDPNEMTARLVALSAQIPKETVLFEDVLEEVIEAADHAAEPYSRALVMSVIADKLIAAREILDEISNEHHDTLLAAFDLVFGAGRDYQHIEFDEMFRPIIEDGKASREFFPSSGGKATAQIHQPVTAKLVNFMEDYMKRHPTRGVKSAAEEATKRGYGAQNKGATFAKNVGANMSRYNRFKKSQK